MRKYSLLSTSNNLGLKIIKVRSLNRLSLIKKELKRNNVKFKINQKRYWFEIVIDNPKEVKTHKLNRATGSSVLMMIHQQSITEAIPSTTKTSPPNRKKDTDLNDR